MSRRSVAPKCRHKRKGIVSSGPYVKGEPHASTQVCDRPACIEDAIDWANHQVLGRTAFYSPDPQPPREDRCAG